MNESQRQEKIQFLVRQNNRRRQRERILPPLREVLGSSFDEHNLVVVDEIEFPKELTSRWQNSCYSPEPNSFQKIFLFEETAIIERFCTTFANLTGSTQVKLIIRELDVGILDIPLSAVLAKIFPLLQLHRVVAFYDPLTLASFDISKHTYYYYGDNGRTEYKWHLEVYGERWAEIAWHLDETAG